MAKLTAKQQAFCQEYLIDLNATQAAIRAGYSEKTAYSQGERLLRNVEIAKAIAEAKAKRSERTEINADWVLKRLASIDEMDVADILDDGGAVKPIPQWPAVWRTTISGFDLQELAAGDTTAIVKKIKWPDKVKNLELIGKHVDVSAFKENIGVNGELHVHINGKDAEL